MSVPIGLDRDGLYRGALPADAVFTDAVQRRASHADAHVARFGNGDLVRERVAAVTAHKQQEAQCELEVEALAHAQRFASTLLARLADPVVESRFVSLLFEDWANLPDTQVESLRRAVLVDKAKATVTTAFPLLPAQRREIESALQSRLEADLVVAFDEDPNLLAGVRLSLGPWQLNMNFADELASFKAAANHVL